MTGASASTASALMRTMKGDSVIEPRTARMESPRPGSPGGELRIEQDGLCLPLLIKGAILGRHGERIAGLNGLQDTFRLRFQRRIGRRIDQLGRLRQRS